MVESAVNIILTVEFSQLLDQACREEINGVILLGFVYDIFDLVLDFFVFSKLSLQEFEGYSGFLFEAIGCQRVGVGDLAWGTFESFDFDDALVAEFREDVVGFPQADAHSFGHFPLSKLGFPGQNLQEAISDFLFVSIVHRANL